MCIRDSAPTIAGTTGGANRSEDITLDAGTGNIELLNTSAAVIATDIGDVTLTGTTISLYDNITTTGTDSGGVQTEIDINGAVVLEDAVTITSTGGNIDFSSTIKSDSTARNFTISSGAGTVNIVGNIGGSATTDLAAIDINASAGAGNITLGGDIGTDSISGATTIDIGNAATGTLSLDGAEYSSTGIQTFTADAFDLAGTDPTFSTAGVNINFVDGGAATNLVLGDNADLEINTNLGGNAAGNISIADNITIIGIQNNDAQDVVLNAGTSTGTVTVKAIGTSTAEINDVTITGGGGIFLKGDITTTTFTPSGSGEDTGDVTINSAAEITGGDVTIDTSNGTGGSVAFNSTINSTTTNQALTINSGGGAVSVTGVIGGEASDHLDGLSINASSGAGTIALAAIGANAESGVDGGNVAIGNNDTTLITLSGADYNVNGTILVKATSAAGGNSSENIKFTAGALVEVKTADDNITFSNGVIHLADATDLTVKSEGGAIDIHSIMSVADKDTAVILNADKTGADVAGESVTIGAVGSGNEIGALTLTGPDGITLQGNITLSNAAGSDLDINGAVTIDGSVTIDTDNASATRGESTVHEDGDINFSSTIDGNSGTDNLTIESGLSLIHISEPTRPY